MRAIIQNPVSRPTADPPTVWLLPEAGFAAIVVVEQARIRAAALHRDSPAVKAADRAYVVAFARMLLGLPLAIAFFAPGRSQAAALDTLGLVWLPDRASLPRPMAVVIVLHDMTDVDPRGWHYDDQLTVANIAVLQVELLENSADGFGATVASEAATAARARRKMVIDVLAGDPRFAGASVGLLVFGDVGQIAVRAAANPAHGDRIAGLALLCPGCAAVAAAATVGHARPRSPSCWCMVMWIQPIYPSTAAASRRNLRASPMRHRQYAGAGYAWDRASYGRHEAVRLPGPAGLACSLTWGIGRMPWNSRRRRSQPSSPRASWRIGGDTACAS